MLRDTWALLCSAQLCAPERSSAAGALCERNDAAGKQRQQNGASVETMMILWWWYMCSTLYTENVQHGSSRRGHIYRCNNCTLREKEMDTQNKNNKKIYESRENEEEVASEASERALLAVWAIEPGRRVCCAPLFIFKIHHSLQRNPDYSRKKSFSTLFLYFPPFSRP